MLVYYFNSGIAIVFILYSANRNNLQFLKESDLNYKFYIFRNVFCLNCANISNLSKNLPYYERKFL